MSKKYKVMLHPDKYKTKDEVVSDAGIIMNTIMGYPKSVTITELAKALGEGRTFVPCEMVYTKEQKEALKKKEKVAISDNNWTSQQLFALDIDNTHYVKDLQKSVKNSGPYYLTFDNIMKTLEENKTLPVLVYESLSHTEGHNKFRVVFALDTRISDLTERNIVFERLLGLFVVKNRCMADTKTINTGRVFYGAQKIRYVNEKAVHSIKHLLTLKPYILEKPKKAKASIKERRDFFKAEHDPLTNMLIRYQWDDIKKLVKATASEIFSSPCGSKAEEGSTRLPYTTLKKNITKVMCLEVWLNSETLTPPKDFRDLYSIARLFPMHLLFGKQLKEPMRCILPGHVDETPSARFEKTSSETYIYHCYGCHANHEMDVMYDMPDLFEVLTGMTHREVMKKIAYLFGIEYETQWQIQTRRELQEYRKHLTQTEILERDYPILHSYIKSARLGGLLQLLILNTDDFLIDVSITGVSEPTLSYDIRRLSNQMKFGNMVGTSIDTINKKLHLLAALRLIHYVDDSNNYFVINAENHRRQNLKKGKLFKKRPNVIRIPTFSPLLFREAEEIVINMKNSEFSRTVADNRQSYVWNQPKEEVDKHYVQDKENNVKSEETLKAFEIFKEGALKLIEKDGFFTLDKIRNIHPMRKYTKEKRKELLAIVKPELLRTLNLIQVNYNKYYAELLELSQDKCRRQKIKIGTKLFIPKDKEKKDK